MQKTRFNVIERSIETCRKWAFWVYSFIFVALSFFLILYRAILTGNHDTEVNECKSVGIISIGFIVTVLFSQFLFFLFYICFCIIFLVRMFGMHNFETKKHLIKITILIIVFCLALLFESYLNGVLTRFVFWGFLCPDTYDKNQDCNECN